jgi:hypothetical protein
MLLKIAIDTIQRQIKKELNLSKIPVQASSASIKKLLTEMGFTEPHDREHCQTIATMIIDQYYKDNAVMTVVEPITTDIEAGVNDVDTLPIDWNEELGISDFSKAPLPELPEVETPASISAPLFIRDKAAMVISKGQTLNIAIASQEVSEIVTELNETSTSDYDFINGIEPAIIAYFHEEDEYFADGITASVHRIAQAAEDSKSFRATATQAAISQIKKEVLSSQAEWKRERDTLGKSITDTLKLLKHSR